MSILNRHLALIAVFLTLAPGANAQASKADSLAWKAGALAYEISAVAFEVTGQALEETGREQYREAIAHVGKAAADSRASARPYRAGAGMQIDDARAREMATGLRGSASIIQEELPVFLQVLEREGVSEPASAAWAVAAEAFEVAAEAFEVAAEK